MAALEQVAAFLSVVREMLAPSTDDFVAVFRRDGSFEMALTVAALAGLSEAAGESAVLFINRVRFRRFAFALFVSAAIFVVTFLFFALSIDTVLRFAFDSGAGLRTVATVVGLSYAPRLFGLLAFIPYFGVPISVLLNLWSVLVMMEGVAWAFDLAPGQALASILLGGLLLVTLQRSVGRPLIAMSRWAMRRAAGAPLVTDRTGLYALLDDQPDTGLRSVVLQHAYRPPPRRLGARRRA